jgi:hypothetical protein
MLLTREFSLPGRKTLLCCTIRDKLSKVLLPVEDAGTVIITNKCNETVATLDAHILRGGRIFAEWDLPLDLPPGVYDEHWTGIKLQDGRTLKKSHKIYVSNDPYCFDEIPMPDFDIRINKTILYKPTIEPVVFTMHKPEYIIFPKTEALLARTSTSSLAVPVTVREGGPGVRLPFEFNSFDEPVVILNKEVTVTTEYFPLTSWEDKAYFLVDTTEMIPETYRIKLRIYLGEFQFIERCFSFILKDC